MALMWHHCSSDNSKWSLIKKKKGSPPLTTLNHCFNSLRPSEAYIRQQTIPSTIPYMSANYTIMSSDNGLSPGWRQAIIWTNAGILLIGPLGTNFSEILIKMYIFSFKKMHLKNIVRNFVTILFRPQCVIINTYLTNYVWYEPWFIGFWELTWCLLMAWGLNQYKDAILPVYEIPLWR